MNFSERLREETHPEHMKAHQNPLMVATVKGTITRDEYELQLRQLYVVHTVLEAALGAIRGTQPVIDHIVTDQQLRAHFLDHDLDYFDARGLPVLPETSEMAAYITNNAHGDEGGHPLSLVGMIYVLEGAIQGGGKILVPRLREALSLNSKGLGYMVGNGDAEKPNFLALKGRLDEITDVEQQNIAIAGAKATFNGTNNMYRAIRQAP